MLRLDFTSAHRPGKSLVRAGTLSRAPLLKPDEQDQLFQEETKAYVDSVVQGLPATEQRLEKIRISQEKNQICHKIPWNCQEGWWVGQKKVEFMVRSNNITRYCRKDQLLVEF